MKRFRLISLFLATGVVAVLTASLTSHHRARKSVQRLDSEIENALQQISPLVSERLDINAGREEFPPLNPYSYGGNGVGTALGGLIDGSSSIERDVVVANGVNLTIESRSDWGLFSGSAYILIHTHDADENDWFIEQLKQILSNRDITIANGG